MLYPVELTMEELSLLRQSLDVITINGKSAKLVANLQDKIDEAAFQMQMNLQIQEEPKVKKPTKTTT